MTAPSVTLKNPALSPPFTVTWDTVWPWPSNMPVKGADALPMPENVTPDRSRSLASL